MSIYLAFDTSTEFCSVALSINDTVTQKLERLGNSHSDSVLPWIDEITKVNGVVLKEIDGLFFGAGPGSFTGLRIACGIAQGLAYGLDKPLIGVSTLKSIAYHYRHEASKIAVLNDARMNECYGAIYEVVDGALNEVQREQLIKPENVAQWLNMHGVQLAIGTAIGVYDMNLTIPVKFQAPEAQFMIEWAIGQKDSLAKQWQAAEFAAPLYVRDRVALTIKEREAGQKL